MAGLPFGDPERIKKACARYGLNSNEILASGFDRESYVAIMEIPHPSNPNRTILRTEERDWPSDEARDFILAAVYGDPEPGETRVFCLDPGDASGWSVWSMRPDEPIERLSYGVVTGGVQGFLKWAATEAIRPPWHDCQVVICERYFEDDDPTYDRDLPAAKIEGALRALLYRDAGRIKLELRRRGDKRPVRDEILKRHGLWLTGSQVGHIDGRDVNDTTIHVLGWARDQRHMPTIRAYWPDPA